jgi:predicted alpha/beta superfamily hydrolase
MSDTPASLMASHRYTLHCPVIGETFRIDVALPEFPRRGRPLPVVYVMDGNTVFGIAAQAARFLQNAREIPQVLMVGVGYDLDCTRPRAAYGALRTRDLTPSLDQAFLERILAEQTAPFPVEADPPAGGADDFLDFLTNRLRPFIAGLYDTDPGDQSLVGSSLGGLFSLHALLTRPGAFQRHVANSPALWWHDREVFAREAVVAQSGAELPAQLFMSVGGLEAGETWDGVRDCAEFAASLKARRYPGLVLTHHVFDGESHTSVIPAALSRGLRAVFT